MVSALAHKNGGMSVVESPEQDNGMIVAVILRGVQRVIEVNVLAQVHSNDCDSNARHELPLWCVLVGELSNVEGLCALQAFS